MFKLRLILAPYVQKILLRTVTCGALFGLFGCSGYEKTVTGVFVTESGEEPFRLIVARTEAERAKGLMFVEYLPPREGALFEYDPPQIVGMWMKNTYIALDMIFINCDGKVTKIVKNRYPESLTVSRSEKPVCQVVELNGGTADMINLRQGDEFYVD